MTRGEWTNVAAGIVAKWPHMKLPDASLAQFYSDLSEFPAEQVAVAVEALYRDGREFPPNGAQIRQRIFDLDTDLPRWSSVWWETVRAMESNGRDDLPGATQRLSQLHPLCGQFIQEIGYRQLCMGSDPLRVVEAQCRGKWEALVARYERNGQLYGLPTAGLKALERANQGPRRIGEAARALLEQGPA